MLVLARIWQKDPHVKGHQKRVQQSPLLNLKIENKIKVNSIFRQWNVLYLE